MPETETSGLGGVGQPPKIGVSNEDFLRALFGKDWSRAHVTGFIQDPMTLTEQGLRGLWGGHPANHGLNVCHQKTNNFFTISVFGTDPVTGRQHRKKALFERAVVVVVDDVDWQDAGIGTPGAGSSKVSRARVRAKPTWVLETSPGNCQVGYLLKGPETRGGKVSALLDALVASGLCPDGKDPGMKGVTRYVRLPVGRNTKARYGVDGFEHRMLVWDPGVVWGLEALAEAYGVLAAVDAADDDLGAVLWSGVSGSGLDEGDWIWQALQAAGSVLAVDAGKGLAHVICPWVSEHSGGDTSGTAYLGDGLWKCHHGHCEDRDHEAFTSRLRELFPKEARAAVAGTFVEVGGDAGVSPSAKARLANAELRDLFGDAAVEAAAAEQVLGPFQKRMLGAEVVAGGMSGFDPLGMSASVLKGLVPEVGMGMIYGATGIGKSFVVMDLWLRLAAGRGWHGHRNKARDGDWIYVSSEGGIVELKRRLAGWIGANGPMPGGVAFYATSFAWGLGTEAQEQVAKFVRWCRLRGRPVRGVVVDTLNRNMAGDENSTGEMTAFIDCMETIWRELDAVVAVVHHEGKDENRGARGSSALAAASEFVWRIFREAGTLRGGVFIEKNRSGADGQTYWFELDKHVFGRDADGDEVSTLIVRKAKRAGPAAVITPTRGMSVALKDAYDTLASSTANGWVDRETLIAEATRRYNETGRTPKPPSQLRQELDRELVGKHGWEIAPEGVKSPAFEAF
jgi:AAA domain/RepB DNA-primase from phage plasmid